jgi:hypothetical protein
MIGAKRQLIQVLLGLTVAVSLASGCASSPTIFSNSDPSVDFGALRTFGFLEPLGTDNGNIRTILSTQLIAATTSELESRGWQRESENPDVLIDIRVQTQEQIRTRNTSGSVGMYRGGAYGGWGGTMSTPTIEQVTQGALMIGMIDPKRKALIWEGTATNRVTDSIQQNREEAVQSFVAAIFAEFP